MEQSFAGKVAFVTGAGSGIGAAVVRRLAGKAAASLVGAVLLANGGRFTA